MRLAVAAGVLALAGLGFAAPTAAQDASELLARADRAFARGDSASAARDYRAALAVDPSTSRAVFQLARLLPPGSPEAVRLFRRYTEFEPQDPWGWLALGDAYVDAGLGDEAIAAYERGLQGAPDEVLPWRSLGRERQRAGRLRGAAEALERAQALEPDPATGERLDWVRAQMAPAFEPFAGAAGDNDDNRFVWFGGRADFQAGDAGRIGVEASRGQAEDDFVEAEIDEAALAFAWRPRRTTSVEAAAGVARVSEVVPVARARVRWRGANEGPAVELRFQRRLVTASGLLLDREVKLAEGRGMVEVPLFGRLRARGLGRLGALDAPLGTNQRLGYGGGLVWLAQPSVEIGALAHRFGYDEPTEEPYFAPERADVVEAAAYAEFHAAGGSFLALDVGAGAQRIEEHDAEPGSWERALRLWSMLSLVASRNLDLRVEMEAYDTVTGEALVTEEPGVTADDLDWRYASLTVSLRWRLAR